MAIVFAIIIIYFQSVQDNEKAAKAKAQAAIDEEKKKEREKELTAERERNLEKIRAAGREEEFNRLLREYNNAKSLYGMSMISEMAKDDYRNSLAKSKKDPYVAGGIANGISGSGFLGAATVIQTELENQRIEQKLEKANAEYAAKATETISKKSKYETALRNLNRLLIECGVEPLKN